MSEETNGGMQPFTQPDAYPGWRPPEAHTLPSGAVFWLKKPNIRKMVQRGQIPNPLMDIINSIFEERDRTDLEAEAEAKGMTVEEVLEERRREAEADAEDPSKPPPPPQPDETPRVELALSFRDVVVWASIVQPRVEIEPAVNGPLTASGALSYDEIDEEDVQYILRFANGDLPAMSTFPAESERPDPGGDSGEVEHEAEPAAGHSA